MSERPPEPAVGGEAVVEAIPGDDGTGPRPSAESLGLDLPEDPAQAVDELIVELAAAREESQERLEDLKRVAADFDNYRKRAQKDLSASTHRATEQLVRQLMPVLDTFDAALGTEPTTDAERRMYSGMLNTRQQLLGALEGGGLEVIPTVGEAFDPEVHEPAGAPEGAGSLVVADELRRGYRLNGKVLRAALVSLEPA